MTSSRTFVRFAPRQQLFAGWCGLLLVCMSWRIANGLLGLSLKDERYTYILAVPLISGALLYSERDVIFRETRRCLAMGVPLVVLGLVIFFGSRMRQSLNGDIAIFTVAMVLLWIGAFVLCFGVTASRRAGFPLLLLLLMIPIPGVALDRVVMALQAGSAELAYILFRVLGVPVLRHGMVMSLPGVDIEVAPQCSGVRSTMALFIAGAVLSRILLRTGSARFLAMMCIGPIGMFRNAVRIVSISWLGVYVNRDFFAGSLHRQGGIPFSLVGFAVLMPLMWFLRRWELRAPGVRGGIERTASSL